MSLNVKNKKIRAVIAGTASLIVASCLFAGMAYGDVQEESEATYSPKEFSVDDMKVSFVMPYMEKGYDSIVDYLDELGSMKKNAVGMADDAIDEYADVICDNDKNKLKELENKMANATSIDKYNNYKEEFDGIVAKLGKKLSELEAELQAKQQATVAQPYEDTTYYNSNGNGEQYRSNGNGLIKSGGVNWYDNRKETYYSSNVLRHYRTDEWTVDDEGFYRTSDGYYVVAASDMKQGTTFQGSKGTCIVLDSGCANGVTDYYVAW